MSTKRTLLVAAVVGSMSIGGDVAMADEPAAGAVYTCDALTSASVPAVRKRLTDQGIDPSTATGPVGLSCTKGTAPAQGGVQAGITGVDVPAFTCASAAEKHRTMIVFFTDCGD